METLERPVALIFKQNVSGMEKVLIETVESSLTRTPVRASE